MISREQFVELLEFGLEKRTKSNLVHDALQNFTQDKDLTGFVDDTIQFLVDWLEKVMGDKEQTINWWVWDTECGERPEMRKIRYDDGSEKDIRTTGDLYDFLTGE